MGVERCADAINGITYTSVTMMNTSDCSTALVLTLDGQNRKFYVFVNRFLHSFFSYSRMDCC